METLKKACFLLIGLAVSMIGTSALNGTPLHLVTSYNYAAFDLIFVFVLNFFAVHCVIHSVENISMYLFGLLLFWFGWLFLFVWMTGPVIGVIKCVLTFYFSLILVLFYISLFENMKTKRVRRSILIQIVLSTVCVILYWNYSIKLNALLFFINILSALIICITLSRRHIKDQAAKRSIKLIVAAIVCAASPYLIFCFVPQFLLAPFNVPALGNWTLYFLLILPAAFSAVLYQRNLSIEQAVPLKFPLNFIILALSIVVIDGAAFVFFHIELQTIILLDYLFLILYLFKAIVESMVIKKKQKQLNRALQTLQEERTDIFKQLLADDHLEKIGFWMLRFLKKSIFFKGRAVTVSRDNNNELFIAKYGDSEGLSITIIQNEKEENGCRLQTFMFNEVNYIYLPLSYKGEQIGSIVLSRDTASFFTPLDIETLKDIAQILAEMLAVSIWILEHESDEKVYDFTAAERIIYLKTADLALRDKKKLSTYLHDDMLQKIFAIKNLVAAAQNDKRVIPMINTALEEINHSLRSHMSALYPAFLDVNTLYDFIINLIEKENSRYHQNIHLQLDIDERMVINYYEKHLIYRMIKELIVNVYKHAKAKNIEVTLHQLETTFEISVKDDGIGIDLTDFPLRGHLINHLGLASIKQEIRFLGGTFELINPKKSGLTAVITLPINEWSDENETIING
ncbi:MAG: ATP-binding protein [Eubacterium sp.]